ncbi:hypothetical protein [Pelomonas sp. KK5]|uniref:hypothetical protein n=1 Tax=Pelomonas sp. KK5 TaxID=1855730 RepID=UPI00117F256C|nr:hypothetical protein [Pelomonas sp. KK5]
MNARPPLTLLPLAAIAAAAWLLAAGPAEQQAPDEPSWPQAPARAHMPQPARLPAEPQAPGRQRTLPSSSTPTKVDRLPAEVPTPAVGAEGYGPQILRAIETGDARQAFEAAQQIDACRASNEQQLDALYQARAASPRLDVQRLIELMQAEMRRCQTLTPDLAAQQTALARRAMRGGVPGAAAMYSQLTNARPPAEDRSQLASQLQADAQDGDAAAVQQIATQAEPLQLPPDTAAVYQASYERLRRAAVFPERDGRDMAPQAPSPAPGQYVDGERVGRIVERVLMRQQMPPPRR